MSSKSLDKGNVVTNRRATAQLLMVGLFCLLGAAPAFAEDTTLTSATLTGGVEGKYVLEGKYWWELGAEGDKRFRFKELDRDASRVYLHDASRDVYIDLDVENDQVWYAAGKDTPKQILYYIGETELASPAPEPNVVSRAVAAVAAVTGLARTETAEPRPEAETAQPAEARPPLPTRVFVRFENLTGAVVEILNVDSDGSSEVLDRVYPDTALDLEADEGETLVVGVVGETIASYTVTGQSEKVQLSAALLDAVGISSPYVLGIQNFLDTPVSAYLVTEAEEPEWLSEVDGGYEVTALLPVGSLVLIATPDGDVIADHVVLPLDDETLEVGTSSAE